MDELTESVAAMSIEEGDRPPLAVREYTRAECAARRARQTMRMYKNSTYAWLQRQRAKRTLPITPHSKRDRQQYGDEGMLYSTSTRRRGMITQRHMMEQFIKYLTDHMDVPQEYAEFHAKLFCESVVETLPVRNVTSVKRTFT
ncbi:MAG: hypothetical protein CMK92_02800 [Pseudomonas sp.]|nr:hypothetical protein [Pseudomonas sp.]